MSAVAAAGTPMSELSRLLAAHGSSLELLLLDPGASAATPAASPVGWPALGAGSVPPPGKVAARLEAHCEAASASHVLSSSGRSRVA